MVFLPKKEEQFLFDTRQGTRRARKEKRRPLVSSKNMVNGGKSEVNENQKAATEVTALTQRKDLANQEIQNLAGDIDNFANRLAL